MWWFVELMSLNDKDSFIHWIGSEDIEAKGLPG